jgi:uncharacterized membrane protein YdjX (TVP38/TMEM64 family)
VLRRFVGRKRLAVILVVGAIAATGWFLRKQGVLDPETLQGILVEHPLGAPIAFMLIYGLAILGMLPTLPLNLVGGLLWGPFLGGLLAAAGATLGAVVAFVSARLAFGRPLAGRFDNRLTTEIQREFALKGWWFVAFMRLNPIFPTGPVNYILGLTSISTGVYAWVTLVSLLPASTAVAYIGQQVGLLVLKGNGSAPLRSILAVSAGVTLLAFLTFSARLYNRLRFDAPAKLPTAIE